MSNNFYTEIPELCTEYYVNYFKNEFLIQENFFETYNQCKCCYIQYTKMNVGISNLIQELNTKFKTRLFVEYYSIFYHKKNQPIHIDGKNPIRYSSLNLTLDGFNTSKLYFYKLEKDHDLEIRDAYYMPDTHVTHVDTLQETGKWVLVNSGVPHCVILTDQTPKLTLCIRFKNNPKYETLRAMFTGVQHSN